eukprot:273834-Chlamydomonas_euryale.AAC.2
MRGRAGVCSPRGTALAGTAAPPAPVRVRAIQERGVRAPGVWGPVAGAGKASPRLERIRGRARAVHLEGGRGRPDTASS